MFDYETEDDDEDETVGKANFQRGQRVSAAQPTIYCFFARDPANGIPTRRS